MSVNRVTLLGNVGADPDYRKLENGNEVASFRLATTERGYQLKNGTQIPEKTEWHDVVIWGARAGVIQKYVHKGSKLYVEGMLRHREYTGKDGVKRYATEVSADNFELLDPKASSGQHEQQQAQTQQPAPQQTTAQNDGNKQDEDLPF